MPWDLHLATQNLMEVSRKEAPVHGGGFPAGAPLEDYMRSPVAYRIGELANEAGLFLFHYEKREPLEIPSHWLSANEQSDGVVPPWDKGVLPERKYQSFRHDLPVGSFHPGHRGKWTTHELCHGLVGFGWREGEDLLFHATAARLAELLPVVVYYFLDEIHLRRCAHHEQSGPLFRQYCKPCEEAAALGAKSENADSTRQKLDKARHFFEAEIHAIQDTRSSGELVAMQWGNIDLCSDGVAYAQSHFHRLNSKAFHRFSEQFLVPGLGYWRSLDDLLDRIISVSKSILEGESLPVRTDGLTWNRRLWVGQDVAWRLLQTWDNMEGEGQDALSTLLDELSAGLRKSYETSEEGALENEAFFDQVIQQYVGIWEEYVLPGPEVVFALGYPVGSHGGRSIPSMARGVASGAPCSMKLVMDHHSPIWDEFVDQDTPIRRSMIERWVVFLGANHPGSLAELAGYEWALSRQTRESAVILPAEEPHQYGWVLSPRGWTAVFDVDVVSLAQWVEEKEAILRVDDLGGVNIMVDGVPWPAQSSGFLFMDVGGQQREVWAISVSAIRRLQDGTPLSDRELEALELTTLVEEGVFVRVTKEESGTLPEATS